MLTLKQIEELIKLNRDNKSIKYVDEHKNPIEPTQNSIVEDIEHIERFNGGPFGGYSEHDFIIPIKNENSLENQSFIKYLLNKFDSKITIISKFLLLVFTLSLFIPIPNGTTTDANIMTKLLTTYLGLVSAYGFYTLMLLIACYIDFISDKPSENFHLKMLFASIIVAPLISYIIYFTFNIITVIQLLSLVPVLFFTIFYAIELGKSFTFDFTKIKRIFFKK